MNITAVITIVAAVSLAVGMASPAAIAFAQDNVTMNMDDNMSSMGNMTGGGNATSMAESESLPSAVETGFKYELDTVGVDGFADDAILR